jgi:RNA 2',3'-cyclic 3'-phosphodiesterase
VSGTLRLFVAADPPAAVCEDLATWARRALGRGGGLRRLEAESLHLTLCFLGEQPPAAVDEIAAVLAGAAELAAAVEELHVGAPAWLPPRRPRVLAVEIGDPTRALAELHAYLCRELAAAIGWESPRQRFRPHITVARMRSGSERARELAPTPPLRFRPAAVALFSSHLDPHGATYTQLAAVPG